MLNCTIYVNSNREISKSFQDFSDFVPYVLARSYKTSSR